MPSNRVDKSTAGINRQAVVVERATGCPHCERGDCTPYQHVLHTVTIKQVDDDGTRR